MNKRGKWQCPKCHTWIVDQAKICSWCGAKPAQPKSPTEMKKDERLHILESMYNLLKDRPKDQLDRIYNVIKETLDASQQ